MSSSINIAISTRPGHPGAYPWLIDTLRDPYNPLHCTNSILSAFAEISALEVKNPEFNVAKRHDFWSAIFRFLTVSRTDTETEALMRRMSSCTCNMGSEINLYLHIMEWRDHPESRQQPPGDLETGRFLILNFFKNVSCHLGHTHVKSFSKGVSQKWPVNMDDIMPLGPEVLIDSILRWYAFARYSAVLEIVPVLMRICKTLIVPGLMLYRMTEFIVSLAQTSSHEALVAIEVAKASSVCPSEGECRRFIEYGIIFTTYMEELSMLNPVELRVQAMNGSETKAMQVCSLSCYLAEWIDQAPFADRARVLEQRTMFFGHYLFRHYHMHMYTSNRPDIPVHPKIVEFDEENFPANDSCERSVGLGLNFARSSKRCASKGCYVYFQEVGPAFRRCSGCHVSSYCSKECAVKDWQAQPFPHKDLCPILSIIHRGIKQNRRRTIQESQKYLTLRDAGPEAVARLRRDGSVRQEDLTRVNRWLRYLWGVQIPKESKWNPGFCDYEEVLERMTSTVSGISGPKPKYMNRLTRWPQEIEAERTFLAEQPFWGQDIEA